MITAIRIEHPRDGKGIFHSFNGSYPVLRTLSNYRQFKDRHSSFLSPREDKLINRWPEQDEYCAFKSASQLKKWVRKKELKEFINLGFKVLELHISEGIIGEYQILYKKSNVSQTNDVTSQFISELLYNSE